MWWIPGAGGETTAENRGVVVNLLLARHQGRLWLLGSGPSQAFARALRCEVRRQLGQDVAEVASPYARAELVLGNAAMEGARVRAPAAVVQAMRDQCLTCVRKLETRLGAAAFDLGDAAVRLPQPLNGLAVGTAAASAAVVGTAAQEHGRWGPFEYVVVARGSGSMASIWRHRGAGVIGAWGLAWFDGAPDGVDTHPRSMAWALDAVGHWAGAGDRVVGETGPPGTPEQVARQRDYWRLLWQVAEAAVRRGGTWPDAALLQAGPAEWLGDPRHLLNAQRAWRLAEDEWLSAPPR